MRRFYCPNVPTVAQPVVRLEKAVSHHVLRVVGIAPHEQVVLFDGQGHSCIAALQEVVDSCAVMYWQAECTPVKASIEICLLVALLRQQAFSTVIRMASEIGVQRLIPVACARSVAQGDKASRWQRIAKAASGQSGRSDIMEITAVMSPTTAVEEVRLLSQKYILLPGAAGWQKPNQSCAIWIGPEGGFTASEARLAIDAGFTPSGLGPLVLRADTAAIAALAATLC